MALAVFWLKVGLRRIAGLVKTSPVITIGSGIIIAALIIARRGAGISLEKDRFGVITGVLFAIGLLTSLKQDDTIAVLTRWAKSGNTNAGIMKKYFLLRAVLNTIPLLCFNFLVLCGAFETGLPAYLPVITFFAILCSFFLLYRHRRTAVKPQKRIAVNLRIKAVLYDYCSAGFIQSALLSIGFIGIILGELIKNPQLLQEMRYPSFFFIYLLLSLSFGCIGVIDAVPHINWKFYALISPKDFRYHFKRIFFFWTMLFGVVMLAFFGIIISFDIRLLPKYFFSLVFILLFSINIAYSFASMLAKAFICFGFTALTVWLGNFNAYFLPVLLIPVGYTFWNAVQDCKDRYYDSL